MYLLQNQPYWIFFGMQFTQYNFVLSLMTNWIRQKYSKLNKY